jgi:hypothetical protein
MWGDGGGVKKLYENIFKIEGIYFMQSKLIYDIIIRLIECIKCLMIIFDIFQV